MSFERELSDIGYARCCLLCGVSLAGGNRRDDLQKRCDCGDSELQTSGTLDWQVLYFRHMWVT